MEKSWAYKQDQLPSTHPIVAEIRDLEDVQVNFDGITYAKGASVLKQLVAWVGQEDFLAGVSAYFAKHAYGNTVLSDLLDELEATSGRELRSWSKLWLETAGVNTLRAAIESDEDGVIASFVIEQTAPDDYPTLRPHRLAIGFYSLEGDALVRTHRVEIDVDGAASSVPELIGLTRPDLVLLNDDDLAYAKIRLDEKSLETAIAHLGAIESPLARSLVWGSAWDATRDAETSASDYVALVLGNIASETESTTIRTTLNQLALAVSAYVAPDKQRAASEEAASALCSLARSAEPGSDAQFQFVKFFAALASSDEHLDVIEALRDRSETLDGLDIDTDLGWELLIALAAGGRADEQVIDAELAADNTATGQQSAAHARAALPTAEGKQAAWSSVFDSDKLPNTIVRSTGIGFQRAADPDVLRPFVERYFAAIEHVWESRSYKIAEYLVAGMYPSALADRGLADATRTWLDTHTDQPPALRRLVLENLAGVERALAAQERDAR
jgi:aminopeptidase N